MFVPRIHQACVSIALIVTAIGGVCWLALPSTTAGFQESKVPKDEVADFMKIKLAAINASMEAAANNDYAAVEKAAEELVLLSRQAAWQRQSSATYLQDTADFVSSAEYMRRMANANDAEGVAASYGAVASSCLRCHQHVRSPKVAALNGPSRAGRIVADYSESIH